MNENITDKFVDYLDSYKEINIHEELAPVFEDFPKDL